MRLALQSAANPWPAAFSYSFVTSQGRSRQRWLGVYAKALQCWTRWCLGFQSCRFSTSWSLHSLAEASSTGEVESQNLIRRSTHAGSSTYCHKCRSLQRNSCSVACGTLMPRVTFSTTRAHREQKRRLSHTGSSPGSQAKTCIILSLPSSRSSAHISSLKR